MIEYSVQDIEPFVKNEKLTSLELELLPYVIENLSPTEIRNHFHNININVENSTIRKRLGNIYSKFQIFGGGPGKLQKLRDILVARLESKKAQGMIFIPWSGSAGKKRAESLREILKHSKINIVIPSKDMDLGLQWYKEVKSYLDSADVCLICLSEDCYEKQLVNSAIGFLYGKIKQFKLLSFESKKISQSSLSHFPSIDGKCENELAKIYYNLVNGDIDDAQELIEIRLKRYNWKEKIELKESEEEHNKKINNSKNILQIIGNEYYDKEKKFIDEIIENSICKYDEKEHWLKSIIRDDSERISEIEESLIQYFQNRINILKGLDSVLDLYKNIQDFPIVVCVLRLRDENNYLVEYKSAASDSEIFKKRNTEPRPPGKGYVQIVFAEKEHITVPDISKKINKFSNKEWIRDNKIKSFASFPLMNGDEVMGTFTIYGDRIYDIDEHKDHLFFIRSITFILSNLILRIKKIEVFKNILEIDKKRIDSINIAEELKKIKDEIY